MSDAPSPQIGLYRFEELGQSSRDAFIVAWQQSFNRVLSSAMYDWIFNGRNRMFATLDDGRIVAGYCLYPLDAIVDGCEAQVLLCNNIFVDPAYQSKMLFSRLGRFALTEMASQGFRLAFGIPNAGAVAGHRRVGWRATTVQFLTRDRRDLAPTPGRGIRWEDFGSRAEELTAIEVCSRRSARGRAFSILKTAGFARWRYLLRPAATYRLATLRDGLEVAAYAVAKYYPDKRCLHIIDIDGYQDDAVRSLIDSIDSVDEPFVSANLWATTPHREAFERANFHVSDETNTLIFIVPAQLTGISINHGLNLVLADNDVY